MTSDMKVWNLIWLTLPISFFLHTGAQLSPHPADDIVMVSIQKPDAVARGVTFQLNVSFDIQPKWFIYARTRANDEQGTIGANVKFLLPQGITRSGKMKVPNPVFKDGHEVYEGSKIVMSQDLRISPDIPAGTYEVKMIVTWQSCNSEICKLPVTKDIVEKVVIR